MSTAHHRSTLAHLAQGTLAGVRKGPVIQWRGVPYAAAPVGRRRFRPPVPAPRWEGVRDATAFGLAAPQAISPLQGLIGGQPGSWSEDCLFLNVFAPAADSGPRPVMVWIHGGAFVGGSGSSRWYDGGRFAGDGDVVVVTLNYRLGALGFLALPGFPSSGNLGLLDQLAALRWIQDNIAAFGGDPSQVTVFGESAGAMCIGTLLAMPRARGLFHRAILQSGAAATHRSPGAAARVTAQLLSVFGGSIEDLVEAPVEQILAAQEAVTGGSDLASSLAFCPLVDGTDVPEAPDQAIAGGRNWAAEDGVAVLIGTNKDEMTLFFQFDVGMPAMSEDQVGRRASAMIGAERWAKLAPGYAGADASHQLVAFATDMVFRIPAIRVAEAMAAHGRAPVWMYRLDWPSPARGGRLGATHAIDIPFVWDLLDFPTVELFTGDAPGRHELAKAMHTAWLAFATAGDPATALLPEWPSYRLTARATMILDETCRVIEDPDCDARRLWDAVDTGR